MNLVIDGTGLSPTARSEYIRFKHKVRHGFIRLTLVVDTDTREILGFSVTDDTVGEAPQFESLTCMALENTDLDACIQDSKGGGANQSTENSSDSCRTQKIVMRADGGFDSRRIVDTCKRLGIIPYIRINHNATTRSGGVSRDRTMAVMYKLGDGITDLRRFAHLTKEEHESNHKKWKKRVKYGSRWYWYQDEQAYLGLSGCRSLPHRLSEWSSSGTAPAARRMP